MTLDPLPRSDKRYRIVGWDSEFCPYHGGPEGFIAGAFSMRPARDPKKVDRDEDLGEPTVHTFTDGPSFIDELVQERTRKYSRLYAHNVEVDIARALEPFLPQHYDLRVLSVGYRVLAAQVHDGHEHRWQFRDSSQISYYASLEEIGELLDHPKLEPPVELGECLCDLTEDQIEDMARYCGRDADLTREWVEELQNVLLDTFGVPLERTAAGTSMGAWRRNYQEDSYNVLPPWHREFIREAYRGGRTELFYKGFVEECHGYDVNSLYPHAYGTYPMPDPNACRGRVVDLTVDELLDKLEHGEGFARCTVRAPEDLEVPYLCYWDEDRGKLTFPRGTFSDTWTYLELREALDRGYEVLEVDRLTHHDSTVHPFREYANDLYELKQEYGEADDEVRYRVVKLLLNSFYGRFGIDTTDSDAGYYVFPSNVDELREHLHESPVWTSDMIDAYEDGELNYYYDPFDSTVPVYCHPEWAAYVTAASRHELFTWFEEVSPTLSSPPILYTDTDSLYTTEPLPEELLGDELGGMAHEFTGPAHFIREKGYALFHRDGELKKVKASGLNLRYLGDTEEEQLYNAYRALRGDEPAESATWAGITGAGRWGTVTPQVKRLGEAWTPKRTYAEDGTSEPFTLEDPDP